MSVHRYPPAVWNDDEEEDPDTEWDTEGYEVEDPFLVDDQQKHAEQSILAEMEQDDGMHWEDAAAEENRARLVSQQRAAAPSAALRQGATIDRKSVV